MNPWDIFLSYRTKGISRQTALCGRKQGFCEGKEKLIFAARMPKEIADAVINVCRKLSKIPNVLCGAKIAYCQRGAVSQELFWLTGINCLRLKWADGFKKAKGRITADAAMQWQTSPHHSSPS